jgi:hypothetical protein
VSPPGPQFSTDRPMNCQNEQGENRTQNRRGDDLLKNSSVKWIKFI